MNAVDVDLMQLRVQEARAAHEAMKLAMEISMKRLLDALDLFPRPRWGGRRLRRARRRRIAANRARRRFRHGQGVSFESLAKGGEK